MDALTVPRVVAALRKVPTATFRIVDLAPHLIDAKGRADIAKCLDLQGDINLAIAEVQTYVHDTKEAIRALRGMNGPKADRENLDYLDDEAGDNE